MRRIFVILIILISILINFEVQAQPPLVQARLSSAAPRIAPGEAFEVKLELAMQPGWHTYTDPPGDAGIATSIEWQLPPGFSAGAIAWPKAETMREDTLTVYGYTGNIALPVRITPPKALSAQEYTLNAHASWLVCKDICIPESANLTLTLPGVAGSAEAAQAKPPEATPETFSLAGALLFALLGGLVLNLMPCVFPVLSLKCLAVARQRDINPARARAEGIAYTLGVMVCFGMIAGVLIAFKSGGEAIGWGYQMQSPVFVAGLVLLLFCIGLNLSGLFDLPVLLGNVGEELTREPTIKGSFATGALATLVATPCTAPFMAAAVGYALTQPPALALFIFEMLGFGLALPFLLVSLFPKTLRFLPRPGAWMETFRQFLAFPMYLSAIWLVWVLAQQASVHAVAAVMIAATVITFIFWTKRLFTRHTQLYHGIAPLCVLLIATGTLLFIHDMRHEMRGSSALLHGSEMYSAAKLESLRAQHKPVFVDATAAWCITCQVNYHSTLSTQEVHDAFARKDVTFMVADWTNANPAITAFLEGFGYKGVPLYVYYPPEGEPKVLPQLLTPSIVLGAME